ncbi:MAG: hypothetical protein IKP28_05915 [Clostridia bacterium]|nr:hypothetical protein [Clostridia bacterium]
MSLNENTKKLCGFCVSDWHFITMITPYINEKINNGEDVRIYTEKDMTNLIKTFLSKLTIKEETRQNLISLDWNKKAIDEEIEETKGKYITIIVNGTNQYISELNKRINERFEKENDINITIINIFDVSQFKQNVYEILSKHDKVLNTSGEKEIAEVFENYADKRNAL